jgi:predicted NBD/HSP70 family sugar kinase
MVGGRTCRCGALGCLEAYVGAEAILDQCGGPLLGSDQEAAFTALIDLAPPRRRGRRCWTRPHFTWVSASRT